MDWRLPKREINRKKRKWLTESESSKGTPLLLWPTAFIHYSSRIDSKRESHRRFLQEFISPEIFLFTALIVPIDQERHQLEVILISDLAFSESSAQSLREIACIQHAQQTRKLVLWNRDQTQSIERQTRGIREFKKALETLTAKEINMGIRTIERRSFSAKKGAYQLI